MQELLSIFKKIGGKVVIRQWFKSRVIFFIFFDFLLLGISRKALEIIRLGIQHKVQLRLAKKYKYILSKKHSISYDSLEKNKSNKVWVCWLQGIENAPLLVKECYASLQRHLHDRDIIVLTSENLESFIELPEYMLSKWKQGVITNTHFSDIIRIEILVKYGGTWIDSTVMCTSDDIPNFIFNSDLFVYQVLRPGLNGHSINISSWFMSSTTNNKILLLVRDLLREYWKNNNILIDYFLLHHFMSISLKNYPDEHTKIPKIPNSIPHILLLQLMDPYCEKTFNEITSLSPFHKLSYKFSERELEKKGTFYDMIVNNKNC